MQYSLNHDLGLMEENDNVRRIDLVNNFEAIDNGLSPFYVAEKTETNVYKITTGASKTGLNNGYSVRVAIPSDSNGAVSIVVDTVKIPVKKPNGNNVTNFKANGVYSLTYYNSVFILASGGMDDVAFTSDKLLTGFSANDSNGEKIDGTMPNHGNITQVLSLNGNITLPSGYYDSINVNQSITARGAITAGHSMFKKGDNVYCRFPQGAYFTNATSGFPEISYPQATIANAIGLTPDKIVAGNTIGGVQGNVTVESLGGSVFHSGTDSVTLTEKESRILVDFSAKVPSNVRVIWGKFTSGASFYFVNFRNDITGNFKPIVFDKYYSKYADENEVAITRINLGDGDSNHTWSAGTYTYTWYAI